MKNVRNNRRGIIDILLAGILAIGSLMLPAVQYGKSFTSSANASAPASR